MRKNYLEEQFSSRTLFRDVSIFDYNYIPPKLMHRDNELIVLSKIFIPLIKNPFSISKKIIVSGDIGVGKTVTIKIFSEMLKESAEKRNVNLKIVHINCRSHRTKYSILIQILNSIVKVPERGLSPEELLNILLRTLKEKNCYLLLILDEMSYIKKSDSDLLYTLSRLNENSGLNKNLISILGIVKDILTLNNLDRATLSTLQNEVIRFPKYSENQIFDILKERIQIGLLPGSIPDNLIRIISKIVFTSGDMRMALKITKNAALYSENNSNQEITLESIRIANSEFNFLSQEEINELTLHEKLILLSICNILLLHSVKRISVSEIKEEYRSISDFYNERPRSNTQIWEYLRRLKILGFVTSELVNKNIRGQKTFFSIYNFPVQKLKEEIESILKKKGEK